MHLLKNALEEMQVTKEQINPLILCNERMHQTKNCWEWWNLCQYSSKQFGRDISRKRISF